MQTGALIDHIGCSTLQLACFKRMVAQAMALLQQQQAFTVQLFLLDQFATLKLMSGRQAQHEIIPEQDQCLHVRHRVRKRQNRQIKFPFLQLLQQVRTEILFEKKFELRIVMPQLRKQLWQHEWAYGRNHTQAYFPGQGFVMGFREPDKILHVAENQARLVQQLFAQRRNENGLFIPFEDHHPQL